MTWKRPLEGYFCFHSHNRPMYERSVHCDRTEVPIYILRALLAKNESFENLSGITVYGSQPKGTCVLRVQTQTDLNNTSKAFLRCGSGFTRKCVIRLSNLIRTNNTRCPRYIFHDYFYIYCSLYNLILILTLTACSIFISKMRTCKTDQLFF